MGRVYVQGMDPEEILRSDPLALERAAQEVLEEGGNVNSGFEGSVSYERDEKSSRKRQGTTYRVSENSSGMEVPDTIHVAGNPDKDEVRVFPEDGSVQLYDGDTRRYEILFATPGGFRFNSELGWEGESARLRYDRSGETNELWRKDENQWIKYGSGNPGNNTGEMAKAELAEEALISTFYGEIDESSEYKFEFSEQMENDLRRLNADREIVENKLRDKTRCLELENVEIENVFSTLSPPFKPLMELKVGRNYRTILVESEKLDTSKSNERGLLGLRLLKKTEAKREFEEQDQNQETGEKTKTSGINWALNVLNGKV